MKRFLTYTFSLLLSAGLLALALRGVRFDEVWTSLETAHYVWLLPVVVFMLTGHAFRAWRWKLQLDHLPEVRFEGRTIAFRNPFYAVLISYMVNYILPRVGEVVRVENVARQEKLSFTGVLGTVVADRTSDVLILGLGFLSLFPLAADKLLATWQEYITPFLNRTLGGQNLWLLDVVMTVGLLGLIGGFFWLRKHPESRIANMIQAFKAGFITIYATPQKAQLMLSTFGIWFSYVLIVLFSAWMLGMRGWTLTDSWVLMVIGSLGMAAPTPGGVGSYHIVIRWALTTLWHVPDETAVAFAVFTHASQLIVYAVAGSISLILQGWSFLDVFRFGKTSPSAT